MKKRKILVADDSQTLLSALQIQLEAHGFEVATCTDAYMALARAQKGAPDVMILDIRMPAGDGFSVLERMARIPEIRAIPIIFITGERSDEVDLKAQQMGACGIIHKPIVLSALLGLIDRATAKRHAVGCGGGNVEAGCGGGAVFEISPDEDLRSIPGFNL